MARLPQLLRYFRLPPSATAADLRQAYLQRVKQVHPDVAGGSSQEAFTELQQKFDEALDLLSSQTANSAGDAWKDSWNPAFHGFPHQYQRAYAARPPKPPQEVPTCGFPQSTVYPLTVSLAVAAATAGGFTLANRRTASPSIAEETAISQTVSVSSSAHPVVYDELPPALALKQGPWNVPDAVASAKGNWSPSTAHKFIDSDSFYANRVKGHLREGIGQRKRIGDKQGKQIKEMGYDVDHEPHIRDGVEMLPVHCAAQDGCVWFLERCGANTICRGMIGIGDMAGDTPLHHAARQGQISTCTALLRLGADPQVKNGDGLTASALADAAGHPEIAALLGCEGSALMSTHPDGLGVLAKPPDDIIYTGLDDSQSLRRSLNMAVGYNVASPIPVSKKMHNDQALDRIINVVRGSLQSTEFDLEEVQINRAILPSVEAVFATGGADVRGLLLYEAPGVVTPDAPGHWVAVRRCADEVFRLDPVRGPFRLTSPELLALVRRYPTWRVIKGSVQLGEERTAKLAEASQEAQALMQSVRARHASRSAGASQPSASVE